MICVFNLFLYLCTHKSIKKYMEKELFKNVCIEYVKFKQSCYELAMHEYNTCDFINIDKILDKCTNLMDIIFDIHYDDVCLDIIWGYLLEDECPPIQTIIKDIKDFDELYECVSGKSKKLSLVDIPCYEIVLELMSMDKSLTLYNSVGIKMDYFLIGYSKIAIHILTHFYGDNGASEILDYAIDKCRNDLEPKEEEIKSIINNLILS